MGSGVLSKNQESFEKHETAEISANNVTGHEESLNTNTMSEKHLVEEVTEHVRIKRDAFTHNPRPILV